METRLQAKHPPLARHVQHATDLSLEQSTVLMTANFMMRARARARIIEMVPLSECGNTCNAPRLICMEALRLHCTQGS